MANGKFILQSSIIILISISTWIHALQVQKFDHTLCKYCCSVGYVTDGWGPVCREALFESDNCRKHCDTIK